MARDDVFLVRHDSIPAVGEAVADRAIMNRLGSQVVTDFFTQLTLSGYTFHVQIGTESAGVASTTTIADTLVWILADQNTGYALIPLLYEVNVETWTTSTSLEAMLELDKSKNRYSSGGTAFTPENLNGTDPFSFNGSAYVGTDITAAAKTAVPDSIELARKTFSEDAVGTAIGSDFPNPAVYSVHNRPMAVGINTCSLLAHFGATTADATGFGVLQFAQLPSSLVN